MPDQNDRLFSLRICGPEPIKIGTRFGYFQYDGGNSPDVFPIILNEQELCELESVLSSQNFTFDFHSGVDDEVVEERAKLIQEQRALESS